MVYKSICVILRQSGFNGLNHFTAMLKLITLHLLSLRDFITRPLPFKITGINNQNDALRSENTRRRTRVRESRKYRNYLSCLIQEVVLIIGEIFFSISNKQEFLKKFI